MVRSISLRTRLIFGATMVMLLAFLISGVSYLETRATNADFDRVNEESLPQLVAVENASAHMSAMLLEIHSNVLIGAIANNTGRQEELQAELDDNQEEYEFAYTSAKAELADFRANAEDDEEISGANVLEGHIDDIYANGNELLSFTVRDPNAVLEHLEELEESEDAFKDEADELRVIEVAEFVEIRDGAAERSQLTNVVAGALLVIGLVILGLIVSGIGNYVMRPLGQLEAAAQAIKGGNLAHRVDLKQADELGQLGEAFNDMANSIQQRDQQLAVQLTETQKAREVAERSDQVKSAFLASMSHELRTPLNSIINFTKFVVKGMMGPVSEEQTSTLNEVIDSAKHLLNLINDVLDMSKIESGSLRLFVEDNVNIQGVLEQVVTTGKSLIEEKPIQIVSEIAADLPTMRGDRQRLLQILLNIMSNACKFTETGQIVVRAAQHNGNLSISIQDSGPGIEPGDQASVFEPFKQTNTGLRQGAGTGLGMPISKSLVEAHGGKLWLESAPGAGATFFVELPIQAAHLTAVHTTKEG